MSDKSTDDTDDMRNPDVARALRLEEYDKRQQEDKAINSSREELLVAGLEQLLAAVHADDPKREILVRIADAIREAKALTAPSQGPRTPLDISPNELNTLATDAFREAAQGKQQSVAAALARKLCQLFDSGGESQRTVRARHASAIFQILNREAPEYAAEQAKCDADPVGYLRVAEGNSIPSTGLPAPAPHEQDRLAMLAALANRIELQKPVKMRSLTGEFKNKCVIALAEHERDAVVAALRAPAPHAEVREATYDMRALAKFLYEHCGLSPDKAGKTASEILSEYDVRPLALTQSTDAETCLCGVPGCSKYPPFDRSGK